MASLALCMIVRNEEEVLARCLSSVADIVDEIVIVDTGSTDTTIDIANSFNARIFHHEWTDDFADARNVSFEAATSDYILWMDADDVLLPDDRARLIELKERLEKDVYYLRYDYAQDPAGNSICLLYRERIVRNRQDVRWIYPIHECLSLPPGIASEVVEITITHRRTAAGAAVDTNRNLRILERAVDEERYRDDPRVRYYLGKEYHDTGAFATAIATYRSFLEMEKGWVEDRFCAHYRLAQCLLHLAGEEPERQEEYRAAARVEARLARRLDAERAEPCYLLGIISMDEEDYREAIFWFELCLRPRPDVLSPVDIHAYTVGPLSMLCVCHDRLGDLDRAREYNDRALALAPEDTRLLHNRAYLDSRRRRERRKLPEPIKLNLGSGNKRYLDYINCDKYPGREVDWVMPLEAIPLEDATVQAIHSEHALEHTYHATARAALREWSRVLKPGGELLLKIPDLAACCRAYLEATSQAYRDWYRYTIYGIQKSQGNEPMEGQIHYTGFSPEELASELTDAGFVIDYVKTYDGYGTPSIEARALREASRLTIGWVAAGSSMLSPQYRIRTYNVHRWLRSRGYRSALISSDEIHHVDTVIFSRVFNWDELELMRAAKEMGKRVLLDICEDMFDLPFPAFTPMLEEAEMVICCSHVLAEKARAVNPNVLVIEDAVEADFALNCAYESGRRLRVVWVGMGGNAHHAEKLRPMIEELGYELVTVHEHPDADIPWELDTWQEILAGCDIAIAPIDQQLQPAKSNNKLTTYMALGLPTVAAPLDAYLRVVRDGENGFIARDPEEWRSALSALADPELRARIGAAAKQTALGYHLDAIGQMWANFLLYGTLRRETVDMVIAACGDSKFLRVCINSIRACTPEPYRIIVVMSGVAEDPTDFPDDVTLIRVERRLNYSEALNIGILAGNGEYVCLMNDDVIFSRGWLEALRAELRGSVGIVNPLSNCDRGWLHRYELKIDDVQLLPGSNTFYGDTIQVRGVARPGFAPERLYGYDPGAQRVYAREWVALYCTLMTRETIRRVGLLDEEFVNGCEDLDYGRRALRLGIESRIVERAFVFHFGGISRTARELELGEAYRIEDRGNHARVAFKYGSPLLVIHTGDAFEPWSASSIDGGGIGGSETAAARMAEELSALGYRVVLFGRCEGMEGTIHNVEYVSSERFARFASMHHIDVFIASRYANLLDQTIRATRRYLWVHDIYALGSPFGEEDLVRRHYDELDGIFCLSPWHASFFADIHGVPLEKIIVTGNGIDLERFERKVARQPGRLIYTSSPDRGLDTLLEIFPAIQALRPETELHIYYGFGNWDAAMERSGDHRARAMRDKILGLLDQPGVFYHGRIGQDRLAEEFLKSDIWLYPTRFTETYCITALEAQMAGVACICTDLAALNTTVGDRGILIEGDAYSEEYRERAIAEVCELLENRKKRDELAARGREWARHQTWRARAREWAAIFATEGIDPNGGESDAERAGEWSFLLAED